MICYTIAPNENMFEKVQTQIETSDGIEIINSDSKENLIKVSLSKTTDEDAFRQEMSKSTQIYAFEKQGVLKTA